MKKTMSRILLIPVCILAGYLLLVLVNLIPESSLHAHVSESCHQLMQEGIYPLEPISGRGLDSYSDTVMILQSGYPGTESAWIRAANSSILVPDNRDASVTARHFDEYKPEELLVHNDNRYWHGQQVFLRPLMFFLNYFQIRTVNAIFFYPLLAAVLILIIRKAPRCFVPFVFTLLMLAPTAIAKSLQFSGAAYLSLITTLLILWNPGNLRKEGKIEFLFLLDGIGLAYLDLLTFPTVTLTIPLIVLICSDRSELRMSVLFKCILFWGLGYAGMWLGKWVIAWIFNGPAYFNELTAEMKLRSGNAWGTTGSTLSDRIKLPGKVLLKYTFNSVFLQIAFGGCAVYAIVRSILFIRKHTLRFAPLVKSLLPFLLTAAIPVFWIILMFNHTYTHLFFTYRTMVPFLFSILCALDLRNSAPGAFPEK